MGVRATPQVFQQYTPVHRASRPTVMVLLKIRSWIALFWPVSSPLSQRIEGLVQPLYSIESMRFVAEAESSITLSSAANNRCPCLTPVICQGDQAARCTAIAVQVASLRPSHPLGIGRKSRSPSVGRSLHDPERCDGSSVNPRSIWSLSKPIRHNSTIHGLCLSTVYSQTALWSRAAFGLVAYSLRDMAAIRAESVSSPY